MLHNIYTPKSPARVCALGIQILTRVLQESPELHGITPLL